MVDDYFLSLQPESVLTDRGFHVVLPSDRNIVFFQTELSQQQQQKDEN